MTVFTRVGNVEQCAVLAVSVLQPATQAMALAGETSLARDTSLMAAVKLALHELHEPLAVTVATFRCWRTKLSVEK
jgi:hypothetical protein